MIRLRQALSSCLVVALAVPATAYAQTAATPPSTAKLDEARAHYDRGVKLYEDNQFESARIEFERAFQLAPSYRILYNLGLVYEQSADYAGALKKFQDYLEQGGSQIQDTRRAEVQNEIAKLKSRVAVITVIVEPGADVTLDDIPVGTSPLAAPLEVNPGRRRVGATKAGKLPLTKVIDVAGTDRANVRLDLADVPVQRVAVEAPSRRVPWLGWGVTVGLGAAAGIFGYLALHTHASLEDTKNTVNPGADTLSREAHVTRAYSITADILTLGAVAAGATSLYYTIKWGKEAGRSDDQPAPGAPAAAANELSAGVGPGCAMLRGTF